MKCVVQAIRLDRAFFADFASLVVDAIAADDWFAITLWKENAAIHTRTRCLLHPAGIRFSD